MEKAAALCSDIILSQSSEDIETALREEICKRGRIVPLGNGIDVGRFDRSRLDPDGISRKRAELGLPAAAPVVGFVGRLVREKGLLEFLEAARSIRERRPEVRFLVIGPVDPEKADSLTPEIAQQYGVADVCLFPGMRGDMPELYSLMSVFVLPSHREGFPRSLMEASAMGVPCIGTDISGCREAIKVGRNGLLVPLHDAGKLAEAILGILADPAQAKRMGEEGRRLALESFNEDRVFERVKDVYARLLQEKSRPAGVPPDPPAVRVQGLGNWQEAAAGESE